nr:hypothetical protein BSM_21830 [uncultured archaeon]
MRYIKKSKIIYISNFTLVCYYICPKDAEGEGGGLKAAIYAFNMTETVRYHTLWLKKTGLVER